MHGSGCMKETGYARRELNMFASKRSMHQSGCNAKRKVDRIDARQLGKLKRMIVVRTY